MSFEKSLAFVLEKEGGYSDHPRDRGGATNKGITQATYDAYRTRKGLPLQPVKFIEDDDISAIYRDEYWYRVGCNSFSAPLDLVMFDSAVNCGVKQASRWLQRAVKVSPDGVIGPITIEAVGYFSPKDVARAVIDLRHDFYDSLVEDRPEQSIFLKGWLNRLAALRKQVSDA